MTRKLLDSTPIIFESVAPDTIVITQEPGHRDIAEIIGGEWARPGQNIHDRPFVVNAIRSRHGKIERLTISIDGTPSRGLALVKLFWDRITSSLPTVKIRVFQQGLFFPAWT